MMSLESNIDSFLVQRLNLLKTIKVLTILLGGQGYLNFCGNEFNHPEWVEFPSSDNNWSHSKCLRQWHLASNPLLYYSHLQAFEKDVISLSATISLNARLLRQNNEQDQILSIKIGSLQVESNLSSISIYHKHPINSTILIDTNESKYGPSEIGFSGTSMDSSEFFAGFSSKIYKMI